MEAAVRVLQGPAIPTIPLRKGPRGGDLDRPSRTPEARRSEFKGESKGGLLPTLHRFQPKHEDVARQGLQNEQAWHRMAAFMLLAGRTNAEIAMSAGKSVEEVSILRAQRWFQELLAVLANETGDDITGLLQSEMAASLQTVIHIRDHSESDRVALSAAQLIIEHGRGKPIQATLTHAHDLRSKKSPQEEREEIEQELKMLQSRRKE